MTRCLFFLSCFLFSANLLASEPAEQTTSNSQDQFVYITIGSDTLDFNQKTFGPRFEVISDDSEISVVKVEESALPWLSVFMHKEFNRCGGYTFHEELIDAQEIFEQKSNRSWAKQADFLSYEINRPQMVETLTQRVQSQNIAKTITELSNFHNRYYTSPTGVKAAEWIAEQWTNLTQGRSDMKVELYRHARWAQPSVMLTIEGEISDEIVVVGGHLDSIAGFFGGANSRAPGADDNASGIATITEIIRVLVESSYRPGRTIQFIGYAAEEVGLRGSGEIAAKYAEEGKNVVGVLQLDMTNFKGSEWDIVLMSDFTNASQNAFLGSLLDKYFPQISWGYDKCGYGCSDHASWHNRGFPASMPFESKMRDNNPNIHTSRDTLERMSQDASHAKKFAQLALAFIAEIDLVLP